MAGGFKVLISRPIRINAPVATRKQRLWIGNELLRAVVKRIQSAKDAADAPAKPLAVNEDSRGRKFGYAIQKQRKRGRNKRDLTDSGEMLASLRVSQASKTRIVISPGDEKNKRKLAYNQAKCEQYGISPADEAAVNARAEEVWIKPAIAIMMLPGMARLNSAAAAVFGRR